MKYYPNIVFRTFILFYILAMTVVMVVGYFLFLLSGLGCSMGCPPNYTEKVIGELLPPVSGIILFLFFSSVILFLQQYKNHRFGYFAFITTPIGLYIFYKIFLFIPIWYFIDSSLKDLSELGIGIFWIVIATIAIIVVLAPFYVLGRLIYEDFFKNRRITE